MELMHENDKTKTENTELTLCQLASAERLILQATWKAVIIDQLHRRHRLNLRVYCPSKELDLE